MNRRSDTTKEHEDREAVVASRSMSREERLTLAALARSATSNREDLAIALVRTLEEVDRMDKMLAREWKDPFHTVVAEIGVTPVTPRGYDAAVTIVADDNGAKRVRTQVRENGQNRRKFDLTGELAAYVWPLLRAAAQRGAR
jgi:hypothetical protein